MYSCLLKIRKEYVYKVNAVIRKTALLFWLNIYKVDQLRGVGFLFKEVYRINVFLFFPFL